jgi:cytochrome c peroxidase
VNIARLKSSVCYGVAASALLIICTAGHCAEPDVAVATMAETMVELGKQLFFDPILSRDRSISCASCHQPEHAFSDTARFSTGVDHAVGRRNTPSAMNTAARVHLFWDGRATSLEEQALGPIENPIEMALPLVNALTRINEDPRYSTAFKQLFGGVATAKSLGRALAAFEKTLETANSPYDRYVRGDDQAMSAAAIRGRLLFIGKANCATCHSGEDFTSDRFKNIGLYNGKELNDRGRAEVTGNSEDNGLFKVPSLRNVAVTSPYMHNGMFATLREVIDYYNDPDKHVSGALHRDPLLDRPLHIKATEVGDLEAFLNALTDDRFSQATTVVKAR